ERKATNKYYPPDWDPSKGSINTFVGQHPLRDRARKLDQGILIIRFEMPFSIWCEGCENHVGKGVRYNAEKKKVGMYYSTPIWQFRMKCHLCNNWIEIHTDPKNAVYEIKGGARKREEEFSPEDNETMALKDDKEAERLLDPMYKLEQTNRDIQKAKESSTSVSNLLEYNERLWKDPFTMSQKIRQKFRVTKFTSSVLYI
ncbi:CWC16 protein, partial [Obelidium mucronatum]